MDWNIVLDSSCNLLESSSNEGIGRLIAPLKIIVGTREFPDTPDLDVAEMMDAMKKHKSASSSACPSVGEFVEHFKQAKNTICITITSALSGTYEAALHAKALVLKEDPARNIHVLDSRAAGGKMVLIADEAERLIHSGLAFSDLVEAVEEYAKKIKLFFSLASFDNLIKNGRMPKYQGMLGQILRIRPVAEATEEGTIEVLDRPRGEAAMLRKIVERMQGFKSLEGVRIIIDHNNCLEVVLKLKEMLESVAKVKDILITPTRGLCSYYTDEGGFIVSY
ncbi:MAG: DegV family protein [Actinomycetia bacterium]|nr:DegV family protein [Actinomycetes bacterium]